MAVYGSKFIPFLVSLAEGFGHVRSIPLPRSPSLALILGFPRGTLRDSAELVQGAERAPPPKKGVSNA